ncbi:hypothetical protein Bca52824_070829 [Brassica carinata]|uniref:Uncharacterized protein n=1 Tax=Brassica carinata TaxID=52824 RepID=A0A8X7Q592_BRACI|nr:hypothetical protein Bca52824_070829 [Brassica carinata]
MSEEEGKEVKPRLLDSDVCRGTAVMLVSPTDGTEEIANPVMLVSPTDGTVVMHQPKQLRFQTAVISLY